MRFPVDCASREMGWVDFVSSIRIDGDVAKLTDAINPAKIYEQQIENFMTVLP